MRVSCITIITILLLPNSSNAISRREINWNPNPLQKALDVVQKFPLVDLDADGGDEVVHDALLFLSHDEVGHGVYQGVDYENNIHE